jgi:DNA-binding NarL/FixJ family response regulator
MDVESSLTATAGCKVVGPAATLERAQQLIEEADCDAALVDVNLAGQPRCCGRARPYRWCSCR